MERRRIRQRRTPLGVLAGMDGVKALATFCLLVYAVVPPFVFCNCSGRCFAGARTVVENVADASSEFESSEALRNVETSRCCNHCATRQSSGVTPSASQGKSLGDACGCRKECAAAMSFGGNNSSRNNCCEQFFKKSVKATDATGVSLTALVKAIAWSSHFGVATTELGFGENLFHPSAEPPPLNLRLLFCVFLN